jgi:lycopene beta-cyclase
MTCYPFWNKLPSVLNIGTAGGGLKQVQVILSKTLTRIIPSAFLQQDRELKEFHTKTKFYDLLLLNILDKHNELGARIFSSIFKRESCISFKFLDERFPSYIKMPSTSFHQYREKRALFLVFNFIF